MKKFLLFSGLMAFVILYSCQKDALPSTDLAQSGLTVTARGGDDSTHVDSTGHHHHHPHPLDSLSHLPCDSTNHFPFDSLGHHHMDSTGHVPHDSTWTHHGDGHPHGPHPGGGTPGDGCHVPPALITIAELPQAAQDWLIANQSGATVEKVVKFTKADCTVWYAVKIQGSDLIRFDADGNKIN